jgi:hypothetical protein
MHPSGVEGHVGDSSTYAIGGRKSLLASKKKDRFYVDVKLTYVYLDPAAPELRCP